MHRLTRFVCGTTVLALIAPGAVSGQRPVVTRCDPGGACASPVSLTLRAVTAAARLADLATAPLPSVRREVRVWNSGTSAIGGRLRRIVEDTAGRVTAEEVTWWSGADARWRAEANVNTMCSGSSIQHERNVALCTTDSVGMPYAANRLRILGSRGVWTLPGQSGSPRDSVRCVDVCLAPGYIVVEMRTGQSYRTYGYPVGPGIETPGSAFALLQAF